MLKQRDDIVAQTFVVFVEMSRRLGMGGVIRFLCGGDWKIESLLKTKTILSTNLI